MLFLLVVAALAVATYYFYFKKPQVTATQDIIAGATVHQNGLIQSENDFKLVVEIEPANLDTASASEHKNLWVNFLSLINTLTIPYTLEMISEVFEMRDYTDDLDKRIKELDIPFELVKSGEAVRNYLIGSTENGKIQDFRGYIILQYNPLAATNGAVIETGVKQLDNLFGKSKQQTKMMESEKQDLAEQMLSDAANLVFGFCDQVGMRYQLLNKVGVLNMSYLILQREFAPYARMVDAVNQNAFHPQKRSITTENV